ncbi:MAG: heme exporter protein CcmB [Rhodobacteraceae bacterium]|nr:heme exporter protein CcmB [Paracoccaceae bacterium]MCY4197391.1 heme exporter protein CcmB [Paracoccaceae bacterium]
MKEILFQEIRLSLRDGGRFGMSLMLFFAIAFLIPLGIGPDITIHRLIAPGVLWVGVLLSSLLALDTLLARDHEDGTVERLVSAPIPTEAVILSKIIAHWLLICFPLCLASPFAGLVMNLQFTDGVVAATTLLLGTPAISAIGAIVAALTVGVKRGHLLQAVLIVPACIPTLIFGSVAASQLILAQSASQSFAALAAMTLATLATAPFAAGALLRLNLAQ